MIRILSGDSTVEMVADHLTMIMAARLMLRL
jgi:hypothetical protein